MPICATCYLFEKKEQKCRPQVSIFPSSRSCLTRTLLSSQLRHKLNSRNVLRASPGICGISPAPRQSEKNPTSNRLPWYLVYPGTRYQFVDVAVSNQCRRHSAADSGKTCTLRSRYRQPSTPDTLFIIHIYTAVVTLGDRQ